MQQLSDREFATRDSATKGLRGLGRLAVPALREALATDSNPEVRLRVEMLLPTALGFLRPLIEAGVRRGGAAMLEDKRG